jgi:hypothetical protein
MARYAYDVNTTQRYIDVHKQFQGGLKTVDTDDALGAVFLREAENVSISEFGFLEKRYGTYENFKQTVGINANSKLQGYWEFEGYIVYAVDGVLYAKDSTSIVQTGILYKEDGLRYPEILPFGFGPTFQIGTLTALVLDPLSTFQKTRDMNAVNINRVLYIFTGTYPLYAKVVLGELRFFLFPVTFPNIDEIIVTGHNLLEDNYETLYFTGSEQLPNNEPVNPVDNPGSDLLEIKENNIIPRIPFAKDGDINFNFAYDYSEELTVPFVFDTVNKPNTILNEISLESVAFRNSGPGASSLDFTDLDPRFYNSNRLNNIFEDISANIDVISDGAIGQNFLNQGVTLSTTPEFQVPVGYWQSDLNFNVSNSNTFKARKRYFEDEKFLTVFTKDITANIEDVEPFETSGSGSKFAFYIKTESGALLDIESKNSEIRNRLSSLLAIDERNASNPLNYVSNVFRRTVGSSDSIVYELWYEAGVRFKPTPPTPSKLLLYRYVVSDEDMLPEQPNEIGFSRLDFNFANGEIFISIYDEAGHAIPQNGANIVKLEFIDTDGNFEDFKTFDVLRAYPLNSADRTTLNTLSSKPVTQLKLYNHTSSSNHSNAVLLKTYTIGIDLEYRDGYYIFELPAGLPPVNFNHYALVFTTTEFSTTVDLVKQSVYFNQSLETTTGYFIIIGTSLKFTNILESFSTTDKLMYPNIDQFLRFNSRTSTAIAPLTYTISSITNTVDLQQEGEIGNTYLNVNIFDNIISGTYDFIFNFKINRTRLNYETFNKTPVEEPKTYAYILKNVTITEEKLQDYPGAIDYPTLKPIWTCNKVTEHFNKLMVWGSQEMPTAVFYSFPDRPSYFPSKFFLDFTNDQNSPVEAVSSYMNILVVQTRDQTWGVRGNSGLITAPAPYVPFTINPTVGTIAYKSVRPVRNHLFFLSKQGIIALKSLYAADEQYNIEFVDRNILNIVPRDDDSAVGIQFDNQYWLNFPKQRITLRWYIDKKAWVKDTYGAWNQFNGVFKYQIVDGKLEFITYPSRFETEGNLGFYKVGVDYSLPTDLGGDTVALFETAFLNQNYPFHPKNYKETKMDFTVQNEYNSGREELYKMETNEHITENLDTYTHTINAPALLKNHRYKLTYSGDIEIDSLQLQSYLVIFTQVDGVVTFLLPNNASVGSDLVIQGDFENYDGGATLLDITYDHILDFKTWIISEDGTLNLENFQGYDQSKADIPIELGARFGDWVFGVSDLGKKVTAIKTIKLAGRGYNVKVYFEDYSKSKWTLESLGITYKMKRPRSR